MTFWAYVLRCSDGSYYTGHSDDLQQRIAQHHAGEVAGYTRDRRPVTLLWSAEFPTREEALAAELQIKNWSRAKKEALIRGIGMRSAARRKRISRVARLDTPSRQARRLLGTNGKWLAE
ncbi:GIY-YIG nuclease family protein [Sphingomonas sp.]|uniref:GIY-YIG nuclease family protein n=1 Tax=Sphingomonas sp. TaxID=28214 RepID=UPI003B3AD630